MTEPETQPNLYASAFRCPTCGGSTCSACGQALRPSAFCHVYAGEDVCDACQGASAPLPVSGAPSFYDDALCAFVPFIRVTF